MYFLSSGVKGLRLLKSIRLFLSYLTIRDGATNASHICPMAGLEASGNTT